ncbi:MAG: o-succinylbenzoate synthase [Candidatus Neomarinimicrobiota bacterium]|nr:MAG: o-succinylbenzoate synthase [Candidatus Neomarinimicrobiota bacterium]
MADDFYRLEGVTHRLRFKRRVRTSRGSLTDHEVLYLKLTEPGTGRTGWGEAAPLPGLSPDSVEAIQSWVRNHPRVSAADPLEEVPPGYPALRFGLETAWKSVRSSDPFQLYPSPFVDGKGGIPINGLVWMGSKREMERELRQKVAQGFSCLKLKIGALHWEEERDLLRGFRARYPAERYELRVDANGAFSADTVWPVLEELERLQVHSIEQPVPAGDWELLANICRNSPVPIALDEELIGIETAERRRALLATVGPAYLILKPTLIGGIAAAEEWIRFAADARVGWWATSALESNLGLNAIAQWVATWDPDLPQGLGTGALYTNNLTSPLEVREGRLHLNPRGRWSTPEALQTTHG